MWSHVAIYLKISTSPFLSLTKFTSKEDRQVLTFSKIILTLEGLSALLSFSLTPRVMPNVADVLGGHYLAQPCWFCPSRSTNVSLTQCLEFLYFNGHQLVQLGLGSQTLSLSRQVPPLQAQTTCLIPESSSNKPAWGFGAVSTQFLKPDSHKSKTHIFLQYSYQIRIHLIIKPFFTPFFYFCF